MKTLARCFLAGLLVSGLAACGKKEDVKSEVASLEKAFQTPAATPAQPERSATALATAAPVKDVVQAVVTAARANDYAGGVIALQALQSKPGLTADQVAAAQRASQAMSMELARRAAAGDQAALAQLKAIERTRSQ